MAASLILHIETATDICSVALSRGEEVLALEESGPERSHATLLNPFIRKTLEKAEVRFQDLDAVAVSKGPGSYTGLRIGVSTAKGLAYALDIPLLSCGTLLHLAHAVASPDPGTLLCPMLDARRMEVYSAFYTPGFIMQREVSADIIDETSYADLLEKHKVLFFGNGSSKCKEVLTHPNALFLDDIHPSARHMVRPVLEAFQKKEFEDVAYFEPFYLKDFVATVPRKKIL